MLPLCFWIYDKELTHIPGREMGQLCFILYAI